METQLLRNPDIFPSKEVLKNELGEVYKVLDELEMQLTQGELALIFDWKYYNDGKSWLCKVCHKKKTVFWLSVWNGFFQTTFFFMGRHLEGIAALETDENSYILEKEWGKMIPLLFKIKHIKQLPDLLKVIEFKIKAK